MDGFGYLFGAYALSAIMTHLNYMIVKYVITIMIFRDIKVIKHIPKEKILGVSLKNQLHNPEFNPCRTN